MPPLYITVQKAAEMLGGVSHQTVRNLYTRGSIKGHREGKTLYVLRSSVVALAKGFPDLASREAAINSLRVSIHEEEEQLKKELKTIKETRVKLAEEDEFLWNLFGEKKPNGIKTWLLKTIEVILDPGRTRDIFYNYVKNDCNLNKMDRFGMTVMRRNQVILIGARLFARRLEPYSRLRQQVPDLQWAVESLKGQNEELLKEIARIYTEIKSEGEESVNVEATQKEFPDALDRVLPINWTIRECDISLRAKNALLLNGVTSVRQLVEKTKRELMSFKNLGKTSLDEIMLFCKNHGLDLKIEG